MKNTRTRKAYRVRVSTDIIVWAHSAEEARENVSLPDEMRDGSAFLDDWDDEMGVEYPNDPGIRVHKTVRREPSFDEEVELMDTEYYGQKWVVVGSEFWKDTMEFMGNEGEE